MSKNGKKDHRKRTTTDTILVDNRTGKIINGDEQEVEEEFDDYTEVDCVKALSKFELAIYETLNKLRTHPDEFADEMETYRQYYSGKDNKEFHPSPKEAILRTKEGLEGFDEALDVVRNLEPLPTLGLAMGLIKCCQDHIGDQYGPELRTGHKGSDGSTPQTRANRYGEWFIYTYLII
eukprot:TRINITY_DN1347_c0_g1_i1.p1 TRINITY_DN1347_c0_g1~~TRINITY_DN1347_c0_g1_i1.p1  ORF type:complete len:178 (+),score=63.73 TRINITY_DN1347_c0_g1_i1:26-559(+)